LRRSAGDVISSAGSVTTFKPSEPAHRGLHKLTDPVFEHIELLASPKDEKPSEIEESTTGSEFGPAERPSRGVDIQNWILASSNDLANRDGKSEQLASTAAPSALLASIFRGAGVSELNTGGDSTADFFDESPDDDELQAQVILSFLARGGAKEEAGDFSSAANIIGPGLKEAALLGAKSKACLDLNEQQLRYARCSLKSGRDEVAEEIFLTLTKESV
jgi:hypothetical protein